MKTMVKLNHGPTETYLAAEIGLAGYVMFSRD